MRTGTVTIESLRNKSDEELADFMASYKESTGNYILCKMEFERRQNKGNEIRGWIALGVSGFALFISVIALIYK